ncbi:hypothetical protein DFP72DRAFT_1032109 [Ephemerocybe angulata]|uniref:HMG domain-containing protein n=1 Tax=Ephemerocybe angulata TaxID=980116 RepID=A0A8H6I4A9_9AGAR|nr:hypothetical protein DFP72DRAFT_1032109 [Tulosesus angulatus]
MLLDIDSDSKSTFPSALLDSALESQAASPTKKQRSGAKRSNATKSKKSKPKIQSTAGPSRASEDGLGKQATSQEVALTDDLPKTIHGSKLEVYADAVANGVAGFRLLHGRLFVVQSWDIEKNQTKDVWHHLQYQIFGGKTSTGCSCPVATGGVLCIHQGYFMEANLAERYEGIVTTSDEAPAANLFYQRPLSTMAFLSLFSVESKSSSALKGRAIVSHTGTSRNGGEWKCSKDTNLSTCAHINEALPLLPEEFGDLLEGMDLLEESISQDVCTMERGPGTSVSYLPIHPPKWTRLTTDPVLYEEPPPLRDISVEQAKFYLQEGDSCCLCPNGRTFWDKDGKAEFRKAKLYTLTSLYEIEVQMQKCPECPTKNARWIGPDLRSRGVFNYNNSVFITHELLDEYTSAYTSSETPFVAWTTQISRRYGISDATFMGRDLFRAAWFAYAYLQSFNDDMACKSCGPAPETVIWDGITLSFGKKHLTSSLRPPTTTHPESQQLLLDRTLRKSVKEALHAPSVAGLKASAKEEGIFEMSVLTPENPAPAVIPSDLATLPPLPSQPTPSIIASPSPPTKPITSPNTNPSTPKRTSTALAFTPSALRAQGLPVVSASPSPSKALFRQATLVDKHIKTLPSTSSSLRALCPPLADLFDKYLGEDAYAARVCPKIWRNFFTQVAAEESVLQLVNYASWLNLREFLKNPIPEKVGLLLSIPAFYKVLVSKDVDFALVIEVLRWVEVRTRVLLKEMISERVLELARDGSIPANANDWRKTGCFYSMPIVRHRPLYPRLEKESIRKKEEKLQEEAGKRGDRCGKYYSQYGERRLTGGIMVCWCTHSICYGFHCIPFSEGRDDVFSAMVTRWHVAPKRVIYDFACALGPYCMLREPQFFGNTYFAIDHFHANGHTKCSPAAFLSEYSNVDPSLSAINSSAAECGNGALRRIRKSVSYMGQERAIIYTRVFLSVWNRLKLRRMEATRSAYRLGR